MKFNIKNINIQAEIGYIMTFDIYFPQVGVKIFRVRLVRPDASPENTWMHLLKAEDGGFAVVIGAKTKMEIGTEATRIYNQFRGTDWRFALRAVEQAALDGEPDDAGMRRAIGEDVEDALRIAGLS